MKNNKCPGIDGFPAEFYKVFWGKIKHFVLRGLNHAYTSGEMSISMRTDIISCIPKGNKPRELLKNWRPISLLSVLYKILSTAIANRLKKVLDVLISKSQTGFLKGRYISENTRLVYDIMHYLEKKNIPGLLMLVDFQKAFDSVSWLFLSNVLKFFNFGSSFCKWIDVLNNNVKAYINQSGFLSESFNIKRGCKQGDPIASYLFLLCAQVLLMMMVTNNQIKGITVENHHYKITQFADDTTIFLDGSQDSLVAALNTLEIFGNLSGLKVNTEKTKLVWLGRKKHSLDKLETKETLSWGTTDFNLLGINFSVNLNDIPELNYNPILNKTKKILNTWRKRHLTPLGKITVIKSFVISSFSHLFSSIPSPTKQSLLELSQLMYSFIWNNKPNKISKNQLTNDYIHGGLKMINLENYILSQKLAWIKRLFLFKDAPWVHLFSKIADHERLYLLGPMWSESLAQQISNPFWKEVISAWSKFTYKLSLENCEKLTCPLWYNPQISRQPLFLPHWYRAGINAPSDIIDSDGNILTLSEITKLYRIKSNFLEYLRVQRCLKKYLMDVDISKLVLIGPTIPPFLKIILCEVKGSKQFYNILNVQYDNCNLKNKWSNILQCTIDKIEWVKIYKLCFKTIHCNEFIWFQYRIIQRILGTGAYLHKVGISINPDCTFCGSSAETLQHLFVNCPIVLEFWEKVRLWLSRTVGLYLDINAFNILFGVTESELDSVPKNILIMIAKKYIWTCSKKCQILHLDGFINCFKHFYMEHEYTAIINNCLDKFQKGWSIFSTAV